MDNILIIKNERIQQRDIKILLNFLVSRGSFKQQFHKAKEIVYWNFLKSYNQMFFLENHLARLYKLVSHNGNIEMKVNH